MESVELKHCDNLHMLFSVTYYLFSTCIFPYRKRKLALASVVACRISYLIKPNFTIHAISSSQLIFSSLRFT